MSNFKFLASDKVKVFPCNFRGQNINIEASLPTEFNLTHLNNLVHLNKNNLGNKNGYIVYAENNNYIFILHGYYFEIDLSDADFTINDFPIAVISLIPRTLIADDESERITTKVLASLYQSNDNQANSVAGTEDTLDVDNVFYGLGFIAADATLGAGEYYTLDLTNPNNTFIMSSADILSKVDNTPITGNLIDDNNYTNSVKLGSSTIIGDDNQVVIGKYNTEVNNALFIIGNGDVNTRKNIIVVKDNKISANSGNGETTFEGISVKLKTDSAEIKTIKENSVDKVILSANTVTAQATNKIFLIIDDSHKIMLDSTGLILHGDLTANSLIKAKNIIATANIKTPGLLINNLNDDTVININKEQATIFNSTFEPTKAIINANSVTLKANDTNKVSVNIAGGTSILGSNNIEIKNNDNNKIILSNPGSNQIDINSTTINLLGKANIKYDNNHKIEVSDTGIAITGPTTISGSGFSLSSPNFSISSDGTINSSNSINSSSIVTGSINATNIIVRGTSDTASSAAHTLNLGGPLLTDGSGEINLYGVGTASSPVFCVTNNGAVTAVSYNATSDKRLKENIIEYTSKKSILDLPIYKFDFINGKKNSIGCLAQDLQEICPEIVHENENGFLSIEENKIVYLLLNEVKKLKKIIESTKQL